MASLDPGACRDFLEVVDDRHGRKSNAISAQLPVAKWHGVFEDATIADAVLDRLVNSAHRIELKGPSLRPLNPQNLHVFSSLSYFYFFKLLLELRPFCHVKWHYIFVLISVLSLCFWAIKKQLHFFQNVTVNFKIVI